MEPSLLIIDMHFHWVPKPLADLLRKRNAPPKIRGRDYSFMHVTLPFAEGFDELEPRIEQMDRGGIGHAVISLAPAFGIGDLPVEESLPLCRAFNDAVADTCARYPKRFSGYCALPYADTHAALAEFERAMAQPGIIGAIVPGDGFLSRRRAELFRPFFALALRLDAWMFVHAGRLIDDTQAPTGDWSDNPRIRMDVTDQQSRLSSSMVTLALTDFLDAFPGLTVVTHNLGGNFPFELARMDYRTTHDLPGTELPSEKVRARRVLMDCNSMSAKAIEMAVDAYGPGCIMFGSDGTEAATIAAKKAVADARIDDAEKRAILAGTAAAALARARNVRQLHR